MNRPQQFLDFNELASLANLRLGYGEFSGLAEFRHTVARQYQSIQPDDVLVFAGASEAIYTFMRSTLNPVDEVVVQSPLFSTLHVIAHSIGCRVAEWKPQDEVTCAYDVAALARLCNERTKLIVINFPHNPTGRVISKEDLRSVIDTARRVNAVLFSDEQFRLLELPPTETLPAACDLYEKAVSVAGVSKTHGLGGLRIGWMASRCQQVRQSAREYRFYTTEMTNTPCQLLAARALERSGEILNRSRRRIASNLARLQTFVDQHSDKLILHPPQAGTMTVVQQNTELTSTALCNRLLETSRIFLVPGAVLGMSDRLLRFGLGREDFADGLERLGQFLDTAI